MNVIIEWGYLLGAAVGVVGVMEYAKGFAKAAPTWVWRALLPLVCIGVAIAGDGGIYQIATNALVLLACCEVGYSYILKAIKGKVGAP